VSEAAGTRGAFWEIHDLMFENQNALEDENLIEYAAALNLDTARILEELAQGAHVKRVREDFIGGFKSGVNRTPAFFINGIRYHGSFDPKSLLAALEEANDTKRDGRNP
jgi:protein-disulfide isomerase